MPRKPERKPYEIALAGLTEWANAIRLAVIDEEDWALVANHLRVIEQDLADKRREIEKDATDLARASRQKDPDVKPLRYKSDRGSLVEKVSRSYSFNTPGILAAVLNASDLSVGEAVADLVKRNALSLTWKISGLENAADRYGIELRKARREIEDGDPEFLVGVVTETKMVRQ